MSGMWLSDIERGAKSNVGAGRERRAGQNRSVISFFEHDEARETKARRGWVGRGPPLFCFRFRLETIRTIPPHKKSGLVSDPYMQRRRCVILHQYLLLVCPHPIHGLAMTLLALACLAHVISRTAPVPYPEADDELGKEVVSGTPSKELAIGQSL